MKEDHVGKFTRIYDFYKLDNAFFGAGFCVDKMCYYFEIPPAKMNIFIKLSKKPSPNAYKLTYSRTFDDLIVHTESGKKNELLVGSATDHLKKFGFPCYISVSY